MKSIILSCREISSRDTFEPKRYVGVQINMKTLLITFLMAFYSVAIVAQTYQVNGSFKSLSYHQGGAELPPEYTSPHPAKY